MQYNQVPEPASSNSPRGVVRGAGLHNLLPSQKINCSKEEKITIGNLKSEENRIDIHEVIH